MVLRTVLELFLPKNVVLCVFIEELKCCFAKKMWFQHIFLEWYIVFRCLKTVLEWQKCLSSPSHPPVASRGRHCWRSPEAKQIHRPQLHLSIYPWVLTCFGPPKPIKATKALINQKNAPSSDLPFKHRTLQQVQQKDLCTIRPCFISC